MTFKELQDDVLVRTMYDSSLTTSGPRTRVKASLNDWHRRILGDSKYSRLRDSRQTFASIASQVLYGLSGSLEKIYRIFDAATNNPRLTEKSLDWLRWDSRADLNTGTPWVYVQHGRRGIYRYPSATGSGLWAASDNAADTTQKVSLNAVRLGGYPHTPAQTTLTGTARVQLGSRTDYTDVLKVWLDGVAAGDVTIYDAAAAGNALATIPIGRVSNPYLVIQLWPVPSSAITYTVEGQLKIPDMALDGDSPLLPEDFHQLLSACARMDEFSDVKKQLDTAQKIRDDDVEPMMQGLLDFVVNNPDYLVVPDDGRTGVGRQGSNLGSWFPAGRW